MRPFHDANRIALAKVRSKDRDVGQVAVVVGPSDEVLTFVAGELVDYENTVVMRQGW